MDTKVLANMALATALAVGASTMASQAQAAPEKEKCYGVSKAGKNDCGGETHSCQGQQKINYDPKSWKYVPKGTCEKLQAALAHKKEMEDAVK